MVTNLMAMLVLIVLKAFRVFSDEISSYFAICAIARDEPDLPEWIEYHSRMGTSKIYLYDHKSSPPLLNFIVPHVESGLVEYKYVTNQLMNKRVAVHESVIEECIEKYSHRHNFIAFIDVDEFIVLKDKTKSIPDILKNYEEFGGLAINWKLFTSSGHITRPEGGVLANYNMCYNHIFVKTILNTKFNLQTDIILHPHNVQSAINFKLTEDDMKADIDLKFITTEPTKRYIVQKATLSPRDKDTEPEEQFDIIYIHHYWSKSMQDYVAKFARHKSGGIKANYFSFNMSLFHESEAREAKDCGFLEMPPPSPILQTNEVDG